MATIAPWPDPRPGRPSERTHGAFSGKTSISKVQRPAWRPCSDDKRKAGRAGSTADGRLERCCPSVAMRAVWRSVFIYRSHDWSHFNNAKSKLLFSNWSAAVKAYWFLHLYIYRNHTCVILTTTPVNIDHLLLWTTWKYCWDQRHPPHPTPTRPQHTHTHARFSAPSRLQGRRGWGQWRFGYRRDFRSNEPVRRCRVRAPRPRTPDYSLVTAATPSLFLGSP